jgi:hypothetical protein
MACKGTHIEQRVQLLRVYRDKVVRNSRIGNSILRLAEGVYYPVSTRLCMVMRSRPAVVPYVRILAAEPIVDALFYGLLLFGSFRDYLWRYGGHDLVARSRIG